MLDILVLSFSSNTVYYNAVKSLCSASVLPPPCSCSASWNTSSHLIQLHSQIFIRYFLMRSYRASGSVLGARNEQGTSSGSLYASKNKYFYLVHHILAHSPHRLELTLVPAATSSLLPSALPSLLSLFCNQNGLFKTVLPTSLLCLEASLTPCCSQDQVQTPWLSTQDRA